MCHGCPEGYYCPLGERNTSEGWSELSAVNVSYKIKINLKKGLDQNKD